MAQEHLTSGPDGTLNMPDGQKPKRNPPRRLTDNPRPGHYVQLPNGDRLFEYDDISGVRFSRRPHYKPEVRKGSKNG